MTLVSSLLLVAYTALSAYLAIATTRGVLVLADLGIRKELMGQLEYNLGQLLAFSFIATMFFSLYKFLPHRKIRWKTALIAALFTGVLLEVAKRAFSAYVRSFNPGSFYSGTVAALVLTLSGSTTPLSSSSLAAKWHRYMSFAAFGRDSARHLRIE